MLSFISFKVLTEHWQFADSALNGGDIVVNKAGKNQLGVPMGDR